MTARLGKCPACRGHGVQIRRVAVVKQLTVQCWACGAMGSIAVEFAEATDAELSCAYGADCGGGRGTCTDPGNEEMAQP